MRKTVSLLLFITFVLLSVSGVQLATGSKPTNLSQQATVRVQGEQPAPVQREMPFYPKKAHEWAGYLFIGAGVLHLVLNKRAMLSYIKIKK